MKDTKTIACYSAYFIMCIFLLYKMASNFFGGYAFESRSFLATYLILLILLIATPFVMRLFRAKEIHKQFLVVALIFGSIFLIINPPILVPDEHAHITRAYDVAKGRPFFKAHEGYAMLPSGVKKLDSAMWAIGKNDGVKHYLDSMFNIELNKEDIIQYNPGATGAYNAIAYLPQAVGTFIGDALNLPAFFVLLLGRITNFAVWIVLCYYALKLMPIKKELLFLLMCLPMGLQQAASYSPDALLNSSSFLLIAYILNIKFVKSKFNKIDILIIVGLTVLIDSVKLPYIAISGLLLLIPNSKVSYKIWGKLGALLLIIVVNLSVTVLWGKLSAPKYENINIEISEGVEGEVQESQSSGIVDTLVDAIKQPGEFLGVVGNTLDVNYVFYKQSFVAYFGWFKVLAPMDFINLVLLMLVVFSVIADNDKKQYKLGVFDKSLFLLITIGMYLILCLTCFMWGKAPITDFVTFEGIQGRYFFPFIIGIFMVFHNTKLKINISQRFRDLFRNTYLTWTLAYSILMIFNFYFIRIN